MTTNLERARPAVDWVGSLSASPLAEVFRRIAAEEQSGDLQVNLGTGIKSVYFDHGFIVFAASNLKRDRLGESLIEAGRISRHEFALASMLMKGSRRKFGEALVQAGVMSEEELGRQVALQVNRIVLSLFKAKDGVYSFDERGNNIPVNLMVSLSIYRIMLEGIRYMTDGKLILSGLPPLNSMVRVAERPPFTIQIRKLKPLEQAVLKNAGKGTPLAGLVQLADADRGLALRACYGLVAAGLLEPAEGQEPRKPLKVQEETGVFVLSEIQRKFGKIRATNARQEILMEFDGLDRKAERDLLKLEGPADEKAVREAFTRQQAEWEKKRAMVQAQQTLVTKVDLIQARIQRAYEQMLREQREAYEEPHDPNAEESSQTSQGQADSSTMELDLLEDNVLEPPTEQTLPPLNEEFFEEVSIKTSEFDLEPLAELAEAQTSPEVEEENTERASTASLESERSEADAAETSHPKAVPKLHGAAKHDRVRQLLRDVKLHFQVRDWEHAVSLLFELVDLAPDDAKHHGMLARAMARHPVMRKDAERHFIEALRLAPQDADLHYSLGLYYKSFGMHGRAENEFRTALRINPRHEGAKKHFGKEGGGKDPLRDMFKKIFG